METNYAKHAAYWDWDLYDRSDDFAFWHQMSLRYGNRVLSPMCALGQAAAYLAQRDCNVTALDYTKEMVQEGLRRFGTINGLCFVQGDVRDFDLGATFDFCFIDGTDLHLLHSIGDICKALCCINRHLRMGGGLGLQVEYPHPCSYTQPMRRFDPRVPRNDGIIIWKEGCSNYDAVDKRQDIHQVICVQQDGQVNQIVHDLALQYYDRELLFDAFQMCGFRPVGTYADYCLHQDIDPDKNRLIELQKVDNPG